MYNGTTADIEQHYRYLYMVELLKCYYNVNNVFFKYMRNNIRNAHTRNRIHDTEERLMFACGTVWYW